MSAPQPCSALFGRRDADVWRARCARLSDGVETGVDVVRHARDGLQRRLLAFAPLGAVQAPRLETTPNELTAQVGRHPRDVVEALRGVLFQLRDRLEQGGRVRVAHAGEQLGGGSAFEDLACVHDHDPVTAAGDDTEIVGDEDHGHVEPRAQVVDQVEDLSLDGHVEGRCRFVGNEKLGIARQCDGDHDPLAETAGELVRVVVEPFLRSRHAYEREDLKGSFPRFLTRHFAVQANGFGDLAADGHRGVERGHRVLEDHRDLVRADVPHLAFGRRDDVLVADQDAPGGDVADVRQELHDRQPDRALAAPGLTDQAQAFTLGNGERHPVDSPDGRGAEVEFGVEVDYVENVGHGQFTPVLCRPGHSSCRRPARL